MPDLTGNASLFRQSQHRWRGYLATLPQTVVFSRAYNQGIASLTGSVQQLAYDNPYSGGGTETDVIEGMTVLVYDGNSTRLKGRLRVASGGAAAGVLQVNEFSPGMVSIADNDRLDVVDEFRIWDVLVSDDGDFNKDSRIAYTNQTDLYAPVACGGGAWAGFVDAGETFATVSFDATDSYTVDPDSGGSLTYLWDVDDGTITVGTTTTSTITATFPTGTRHVTLTVTDSSNSKTSTIYIPVLVRDKANNAPLRVLMESYESGLDTPPRAQFRLPAGSESSIATLPDGAPVFYFEEEVYAGTAGSYGGNAPADRAHMKFVGYLDADSLEYDVDNNEVQFTALSPLAILEKTAALPQILTRDASPANWQEASDLTLGIMFWYLWAYGAAIQHDILYQDTRDFNQVRVTVEDTSSIAGQLRDIGNALNLAITCDRLGRIYAVRKPAYMTVAEKANVTTTYQFTTDDVLSYTIPRSHRRSVKKVRGEGTSSATAISSVYGYFSQAPGVASGEGTSEDTLSRQGLDASTPQADLNVRTGNRYGEVNNLFWNETTNVISIVPAGASLVLPSGYDVFDPAYLEFVELVLSDDARGVTYTASSKWIIQSMSVTYDSERGVKEVSLTINHDTHAPAGATVIQPAEEDNGLPDYDLPTLDIPSFDLPDVGTYDNYWLTKRNGTMAAIPERRRYIYITTNFKDPTPTWTQTNITNLSAAKGNIVGFTLDANTPTSMWILTTAEIGKVTDIFGTPTYATQATLTDSLGSNLQGMIRANIAAPNNVIAAFALSGIDPATDGSYTRNTTDGSTWNARQRLVPGSPEATPGVDISPLGSGVNAYFAAPDTTLMTTQVELFSSSDAGASWSSQGYITGAVEYTRAIHIPVNAGGLYWYGERFLYRSDTGTTDYIASLPSGDSNDYQFINPGSISTDPTNRKKMAIAVAAANASRTAFINWRVFVSSDEGSSWIESPNPTEIKWRRVVIDGNGENVYAIAERGRVGVQSFSALLTGAEFEIKADFSADLGTLESLLGIVGGGD